MNRYALIEALQQLDAQYAHWVANLKIYGAFDPRTKEQHAYYRGRLEGLRTALMFEPAEVVTYEGRHYAIKTDGSGNALPDEAQPFGFGTDPQREEPTEEQSRIIAEYLEACPTSSVDLDALKLSTTETAEYFDSLEDLTEALAEVVREFRRSTAPALIFATRRDKYGHREYLTINTENGRHTAIMERDRLAHRSDFVEVGARDLDKLRDILSANSVYIERR